jgi:hypothetical protein
MPKISVVIEYDSPEDPLWLNPDNVAIALSSYCKNTSFSVKWADGGNPWANSEDSGTQPTIDNSEYIK